MDAEKPTRNDRDLPTANPAAVSAVRRKLIKTGAFVPPVILTLRSGAAAAAAAASNAASCLATDQEAAQEAEQAGSIGEVENTFELAAEPDQWLRSRVVVREARRVIKKKGKWKFKGHKVVQIYTHEPKGAYSWWSIRPSRQKRKFHYEDSGEIIQVHDESGTVLLLPSGVLMYRNGVKRRRYVGIEEIERYGIVMTDESGEVVKDDEGMPTVGAVVDGVELESHHVSASCWASLNPGVAI
jgi:hypothetical protein